MYFFTFESDLPDEVGFAHFSSVHLVWLGGIALGLALLSLYYAGRNRQEQQRLSRVLAWLMCGNIVVEYCILAVTGHLTTHHLPLQLCEMVPFLCLLFAYTRWDWVGQTLYSLCWAGALCALLFPNWNMYPQWNFMNLTGFLTHAGLLLFPLWQLLDGTLRPRMLAMWKPLVFLAAVVPPLYWLDKRWHTNYFFLLGDSPNSPLTVLYRLFGKGGYLPAYALLVLTIMVLEYLPWRKREVWVYHPEGET